jgi:ssDNA-binding Zn-finger/Zn-ribbon topoisomerase 1
LCPSAFLGCTGYPKCRNTTPVDDKNEPVKTIGGGPVRVEVKPQNFFALRQLLNDFTLELIVRTEVSHLRVDSSLPARADKSLIPWPE